MYTKDYFSCLFVEVYDMSLTLTLLLSGLFHSILALPSILLFLFGILSLNKWQTVIMMTFIGLKSSIKYVYLLYYCPKLYLPWQMTLTQAQWTVCNGESASFITDAKPKRYERRNRKKEDVMTVPSSMPF